MSSIALIGNMNNVNFALLRYFIELGYEAELFTYSNEIDHFLPQLDTTNWHRWQRYVHPLGVSNGGRDALFGPLHDVERKLANFDICLGNGISPVLFKRMNRVLDVFVPYGEGCEFVSEFTFRVSRPLSTLYSWVRRRAMIKSLRSNVRTIITHSSPPSAIAYRGLGKKMKLLPLLTKYDPETICETSLTEAAREAIDRMESASLAVFSQAQHRWKTMLDGYLFGVGKRNHWLIEGFAHYVQCSGDTRAVLCLLEYGPDVEASKELIGELGISAWVVWLPMMSRLDLLAVARHADVGVDAFHGSLWGGTGWELISLGVPLIHFLADPTAIEWEGIPLPPFFNVESPGAIAQVLLTHNRQSFAEFGLRTRQWHETYQGEALAKRYLALFDRSTSDPLAVDGHSPGQAA